MLPTDHRGLDRHIFYSLAPASCRSRKYEHSWSFVSFLDFRSSDVALVAQLPVLVLGKLRNLSKSKLADKWKIGYAEDQFIQSQNLESFQNRALIVSLNSKST